MKFFTYIVIAIVVLVALWCVYIYKQTSYYDAITFLRHAAPCIKYNRLYSLENYLTDLEWSFQYGKNIPHSDSLKKSTEKQKCEIYNIKNKDSILVGDIRTVLVNNVNKLIVIFNQRDGREMSISESFSATDSSGSSGSSPLTDIDMFTKDLSVFNADGLEIGTLVSDIEDNSFNYDDTRDNKYAIIPFTFKWKYTNVIFK